MTRRVITLHQDVPAGTYELGLQLLPTTLAPGEVAMPIVFKAMSPNPNPGPQPPGAPTNLRVTGATSSSVALAWNTVAGAVSYSLYRNNNRIQTGIVGTTVTNSGLSASTSYQYYVTGQNAVGEGPASNTVTGTTQSSSSTIKYNPGHYGSSPTLIQGSNDITHITSIYNAIVPYTNVLGLAAVFSWGALEPTKGELDTSPTYPGGWATCRTKVRQFIDIMAAMSPPRQALIKIQLGAYTSTHPSINDFGIIPQYIQTDSTYGPTAGYRISGTTTTVPGRYGWWGGNGNGNTFSVALHRSVVTNRLKLLLAAIAAEADGDPNYEGTYFDEDSFIIGAWTANGPPDYSQTNFNTNVQSMLSFAVSQFQHTSVMWQVSFSGTSTNSQDFCAFMTANRVDWSNTDVLGKTYADAHAGQPYTWGAQAMCGFVPSGGTRPAVNYRDQGYSLFPEVQGNDLGAFNHAGLPQASTKEDILAMANQVMKCRKLFWNIMLPPASNWGGTLLPNSTWDFMGPYLNDPANALLNTSTPVNY
jgi:hypothetical protein